MWAQLLLLLYYKLVDPNVLYAPTRTVEGKDMPSRTAIGQEEKNKVNFHLNLGDIINSSTEKDRESTRIMLI